MRNSPEDRARWNEQRKKIVTTMWNEGQSSTHIANTFGVSRSAILGLIHRLGLSNRRVVTPRAARKPKAPTKFNFASNKVKADTAPSEPYVHRETVVTPEESRVVFEALEAFDRRCRYAHGETLPYTFCGAGTVGGTSWCREHLKVVSGAPRPEVFREASKNPEPENVEKSRELEGVA